MIPVSWLSKRKNQFDVIYIMWCMLLALLMFTSSQNKAQVEQLSDEFKKLSEIFEVLITREESVGWTTLKIRCDGCLIFDTGTIQETWLSFWTCHYHKSHISEKRLIVFLVTKNEKENIGCDIPKFSLNFVSFP